MAAWRASSLRVASLSRNSGSSKTVAASSKATPCSSKLSAAFVASHAKVLPPCSKTQSIGFTYISSVYLQSKYTINLRRSLRNPTAVPGSANSPAEQSQERMVSGQHQPEPHRHAEHEGEGEVRHAVRREEQCRDNLEQCERPQDETDDRLEDHEEHEHRQPDRMPKNPGRAPKKIVHQSTAGCLNLFDATLRGIALDVQAFKHCGDFRQLRLQVRNTRD